MRRVAIAAVAVLFGTAAFGQSTTTIRREEGPLGSQTTVTKKDEDGDVTRRTETTTGGIGCETKSTTKTNEDGDTKSKTVTRC